MFIYSFFCGFNVGLIAALGGELSRTQCHRKGCAIYNKGVDQGFLCGCRQIATSAKTATADEGKQIMKQAA